MNLNEAVLSVLSETETMGASAVIFEFVQDPHGLAAVPSAREIVNALESMAKTGEVAMSWSHQSMFRRRSSRELGEYLAVKAGTQRELL
jgi:hypothetical protein